MSDWTRPARPGGRRLIATVLAVVLLAAGFVAGRWLLSPAGASGTGGPAGITAAGRPGGYTHTALGARTAAVNAVIAGLWLDRGNTAAATDLAVPGAARSPAVRLLLGDTGGACAGLGTATVCGPDPTAPQRATLDFAPDPAQAGYLTGVVIPAEPQVNLAADGTSATVTLPWVEARGKDGTTAHVGYTFTLLMAWVGGDWKVADVHAASGPATWSLSWLTVSGLITEHTP